jgi:phosphoribosyl 1,2-cyclic phosphodiesterase
MRAVVLGSGSRGNAVVVESGGARILIDAGFSCRQLELRMAARGVDPKTLGAVILTHEHGDHVKGVSVLVRRYGLPVYATEGTLDALKLPRNLARDLRRPDRVICSGRKIEVAGFEIEPFTIPHDAREPVGMVVEDSAGRRLGLAADLGSRTRLAWARLQELDMLVLEANHDLEMLRSGPYPWALKQRVAGRHGHLSNREAADGLPELVCDRLRRVVLYHLSQTNNLPALAAATVGEALDNLGSGAEVTVTFQDEPSPWLEALEETETP